MSILVRSFNNEVTDEAALGTFVPTTSAAWVAPLFTPGDDSLLVTFGDFTKSASGGTTGIMLVPWYLVRDNAGVERVVMGQWFIGTGAGAAIKGINLLVGSKTSDFTTFQFSSERIIKNVAPLKFYVTSRNQNPAGAATTFTGNVYISSFNSQKTE